MTQEQVTEQANPNRLAPEDGARYLELKRKFQIARGPRELYWEHGWWSQYQDGDHLFFVKTRPGTSFDEHYSESSMP